MAKFANWATMALVSTMNVSLPESLVRFVARRVARTGYGSASEYVRELIRRDQSRERLRAALLEGLESGPAVDVDEAFWDARRERLPRRRSAK